MHVYKSLFFFFQYVFSESEKYELATKEIKLLVFLYDRK